MTRRWYAGATGGLGYPSNDSLAHRSYSLSTHERANTIEALMNKSDLQVGLEALFGNRER